MLMEDCSIEALTCGSQNASDIATALDNLENCAAQMIALIGATKALLP